jgi:acetyl esterase/lipase
MLILIAGPYRSGTKGDPALIRKNVQEMESYALPMPPIFLLEAEDDPIDPVKNSLVYYAALKKAGVPVEMHLYAHGGHGFGLRHTKFPITDWPQLVERWLKTIGMTSE